MMIIGLESFLTQNQQIIPGIHLLFIWVLVPFILIPAMVMMLMEAKTKSKKFEIVFYGTIGYFLGVYMFNV